jgi:hypothetical protein
LLCPAPSAGPVPGIEPDGERAVVDELHGHLRAELAEADVDPVGADPVSDAKPQGLGDLG